ncbi:GlxA family transcriptional regulator [Sphingopyxis sp. R3-92]|uniref:GlxA family transcriptional regulator n=1 Tax=Sphingopyxis sp. R3-92 TaxID=3158553 RepID=UPI003EE56F0D
MYFYVCPGHQLLDVAGPMAVVEAANRLSGNDLYHLAILSNEGGAVRSSSHMRIETDRAAGQGADTLVVVGGEIEPLAERADVESVQRLSLGSTRIVSICTGAFLLAEAGLLDGRRATTHWSFAGSLKARYPHVLVDSDLIFVNDGPIWTSAGMTAGIDLMLALVEADHGHDLAKAVSRELVVYLKRPGGQSQYAAPALLEPETDRIRRALSFAREHLSEALPIERLAEAANLSERQFARTFRKETGETPAKAVERMRAEAARIRLRAGLESVEAVARAVGFEAPERMRRAFQRSFGNTPQLLRRLDRATEANVDGLIRWPPGQSASGD